jgi:Ca-activated chloride channel family protein
MATQPTATSELKSLSGRQDQVALRGVRVRSRLAGMSQKTTVEQMFVNLEPRAIEAVYTFPLPEGAAVCGFEVITGDRVLTGTIDENEKAIEKYENAVDQGHGAFMLEADRPDVFTARVGNLKPRQSATIRLTYVAPLERVDKQIRVTFPTTVAPRFTSPNGMDPLEGMIDGDALNPPKALHVPYGLSLEVDVDLQRKVRAITSPTHNVRVMGSFPSPGTPGEGRGGGSSTQRVLLEDGITAMDRDIVLNIDLAREHEPAAQAGRGPDGAPYVAVTFVPEFEVDELSEPAPSETVFVLDCSSSMQGESIEQAVAALQLCLRSLSPGDTFNICRFGSTFELMSSEPLAYSEKTLAAALQYIDRRADLGGTEILPALEAIFATRPRAGGARSVIVLTDGQVSNEPGVIALARRHRDRNRIFSFGIGSAASSFLVKGLARATRGAAEFISGDERIDEKVLRTFSRMTSPMVSELEIDWCGADVQTLAEIPPVFDGDVLTVFGRVQGSAPKSVTLRCVAKGQPHSWSVALPSEQDDGGLIATMWARRTIQSMEEVNDIRRVSGAGEQDRERRMIIEISKQFNLVSSLTTFIAIEHRSLEERNEGRPALRRVPVALAAEWGGGLAEIGGGSDIAATAFASRSIARLHDSLTGRTMDRTMDASRNRPRGRRPGLEKFVRGFISGAPAPAPTPSQESVQPPAGDLQALLAQQSADGWFDWNESLVAKLIPQWKDWDHAVNRSLGRLTKQAVSMQSRIGHTAVALLILRLKFIDQQGLWRRAELKARRWLASVTGSDPVAVQSWISDVMSQLHPQK